ncbi:MAG: ribonuclease H family protein [Gudongella sp.]|jgi:ribonuclease HI|nr:ribonuclease H family protein [Gudongella sp.]
MNKKYYAVRLGRKPGVYETWEECKNQVHGYPGSVYKSFLSKDEALAYVKNSRNFIEKTPDNFSEGEAFAYVDGSYDAETGTYSYGIVILTLNEKITMSGRETDRDMARMRNVAGELKGAMEAMSWAVENGFKKLRIYYDYSGIEEWANGLWKTNKEGTKAYKEYYDSVTEKLQIEFVKVKAHSGDEYNEEADSLARNAL